jgi:phospholipase/carboxylesterase
MLESELVPAQEKNSRRLMVVLHGLGDSMEGYRWMPEALQLPWLNYLLVNAPDEYYGGYSWYDFANDPGPGVIRSRKLLFGLLDELPSKGFAASEITVFGFSQGCLMTMEVALRYAHRLAGLVGISGYVHEPERALKELFTHGSMDPLIPFPAVKAQVKKLQAEGLRIEWHEFAKEHTIAGEAELKVIRDFVQARYDEMKAR